MTPKGEPGRLRTHGHGPFRGAAAHQADDDGVPVPGLYAAGEATGGLFHGDCPGGAALMRAVVFGRAAGRTAAAEAR
ncbi:FAD-binding protein [Streptomyces sp. NPDC044780]|uniref:FAD-binding protein n=1 Tax=unclassified Streptomyces TaxID=2593676 RepID=UPI0033F5FFEC